MPIGNTYTTGQVSGANPVQSGVTTQPNALVLVFLGCNANEAIPGAGAYSVSDNSGQGLTWNLLLGPPTLGQGMYVFGAFTTAGLNNATISVTPSGQNSSYAAFMTVEVDGTAPPGGSPTLDGSAYSFATAPTSATFTTAFSNDILFGFYLDQAGGASSYTPGSGYTTAITTGTWQSQIGTAAAVEYLTVTSAGSQTVPSGTDSQAGLTGFYGFAIKGVVTGEGAGTASAAVVSSSVASGAGHGSASSVSVSTTSTAASAGGAALATATFGSVHSGEGGGQASASVLVSDSIAAEGKGSGKLVLGGPVSPIVSSSVAAVEGGGQAVASVSTSGAANTTGEASGHAAATTLASSVTAGEGSGASVATVGTTAKSTGTGGGQASAAVSNGAPVSTTLFSGGSASASVISSAVVFAQAGGAGDGMISNSGTIGVHVKALLVTKGYAQLTATKD